MKTETKIYEADEVVAKHGALVTHKVARVEGEVVYLRCGGVMTDVRLAEEARKRFKPCARC